ncbi:hypothetical protein J7J18_04440 [bacterium]|nr:hypothetical protein [bacterium]
MMEDKNVSSIKTVALSRIIGSREYTLYSLSLNQIYILQDAEYDGGHISCDKGLMIDKEHIDAFIELLNKAKEIFGGE